MSYWYSAWIDRVCSCILTWFETKTGRGPTSAKIPMRLTDVTIASTWQYHQPTSFSIRQSFSTDRFAPKWSPNNRPVMNSVFCYCTSRYDSALRDVISIHDTDNIVLTCAGSFDIVKKSSCEVFLHSWSEKGRVQCDYAFKLVEEKHVGPLGKFNSEMAI